MFDKYYDMKINYDDYILFFKKGKFYYVYKEDAYIISYLTNYKLVNDMVSFPDNCLNKIIKLLEEKTQGYIIYKDSIIIKEYGNSEVYTSLLDKAYIYIARIKVIKNINDKINNYTLDELVKVVSII